MEFSEIDDMSPCRSSIRHLIAVSRDALCCVAIVLLWAPASSWAATILVEAGSKTVWKFVDDGSEPSANWAQPEFDDSKWKAGRAPLGYGEKDLATELSFGGVPKAKYITSYFRHGFKVDSAHDFTQLVILLRVDDGAIVYLNGKEVARENIAAGPANSKTSAQRRIEGNDEGKYSRHFVPKASLVAGQNTLAVEVHQCNAVSSDLVFDVQLKGYRDGEVPRLAKLESTAQEITETYREKHYLSADRKIPNGYVDGGRDADLAATEHVKSIREVIVVDRTRDPDLQKHLAFAGSKDIRELSLLQRARALAKYVDAQCSPPEGRNASLAKATLVESEYQEREFLLGRSGGTGVCRHRALLFKVLGDEAGLNVALVRGNYATGKKAAGHVWNELIVTDEKTLIVDCMNPQVDFSFPETTTDGAKKYLTVKNEPFYPAK